MNCLIGLLARDGQVLSNYQPGQLTLIPGGICLRGAVEVTCIAAGDAEFIDVRTSYHEPWCVAPATFPKPRVKRNQRITVDVTMSFLVPLNSQPNAWYL